MKRIVSLLVLVSSALALAGCATETPAPAPPRVTINAPANNSTFDAGQDIAAQAVAEDAQGIARVELLVDGQTIKTDASPNGAAQKSFATMQTWKATGAGVHVLVVRATNMQGAIAEAAVSVNVVEKIATPTPMPNVAKPIPTKAPVVATVAPTRAATTLAAAPTSLPTTTTKHTLVLTEAQINALINRALAASVNDYVTASNVSLRNGQITVKGTYKATNGASVNGTVVVALSASNCDVKVAVLQAQVGAFVMPDARKAQISASIDQALTSTLAQQYDYHCVETITIANGVMTVVYR
ncbi:MAG: Ig-like domain-containing protein [Chloroflexi bacterium]|nr:Ig-like domain-containing protein [Chloroflexota bacterium]